MDYKRIRIAVPMCIGLAPKYIEALTNLDVTGVIVRQPVNVDEFDGLLLPGGYADVCPERYGQVPTPGGASHRNEPLDDLQFAVLDQFVKAKKPVFGICRGHQLINVYFGGILNQNIPTADHHICGAIYMAHDTTAAADSFLAPLYGEKFPTNTSHHQAVETLGKGMTAVQFSDDNVVEATQHESLPVWSVQWHPELMCFHYARPDTVDGSVVLRWFLEQCKKYRK